jgi:NDP-sugar pyrophosphorylase family protein
VLAAGMGSRYGSLKQLDAFGPHGETIMDYAVYDAVKAGFGKIFFVIRRNMEKAFTEAVVAKIAATVSVELIFQDLEHVPGGFSVPTTRQKPWGTGHALWSAARQVQTPFAVINADDFYGLSAFRQVATFLGAVTANQNPPTWCMVGYPLAGTLSANGPVSRGLCEVDATGNLLSVKELKEINRSGEKIIAALSFDRDLNLTGHETVSMNFWGFTPAVFPILENYLQQFLHESGHSEKEEFYLSEAVNRIVAENLASVQVLTSSDHWMGVTYPEDKEALIRHLANLQGPDLYPSVFWPTSKK